MGTVGGRGFGDSVKFADGKTSSANVPHLNVWGLDISAAEFTQQTKTRVFGVNRPLNVFFYKFQSIYPFMLCTSCMESTAIIVEYEMAAL